MKLRESKYDDTDCLIKKQSDDDQKKYSHLLIPGHVPPLAATSDFPNRWDSPRNSKAIHGYPLVLAVSLWRCNKVHRSKWIKTGFSEFLRTQCTLTKIKVNRRRYFITDTNKIFI
jgi:hypothetical protein